MFLLCVAPGPGTPALFHAGKHCHVNYGKPLGRADAMDTIVTKADEYRARAKACEQKAEEARDPRGIKQNGLTAQTWRRLAEMAEKHNW